MNGGDRFKCTVGRVIVTFEHRERKQEGQERNFVENTPSVSPRLPPSSLDGTSVHSCDFLRSVI
ncbi:hypothetical protein WN55_02608 [Dufourea novaeangliae]|uniref:Uncharacterized protein n=1 Tax=Dufourea novaeangliae TaxID=178035 RepID=A0A154PI76_DUFNO|nr:hypothetical protein WN55_02608 [Dufourea novaeangliae]